MGKSRGREPQLFLMKVITKLLKKIAFRNNKNIKEHIVIKHYTLSYLPTPPLGQDMTQGQFLSGV